jgi:hypothetical protein
MKISTESFFLPFIDQEIFEWDNEAWEKISLDKDKKNNAQPSHDDSPDIRPYESLEDCRNHCESKEQCLSYRFKGQVRMLYGD